MGIAERAQQRAMMGDRIMRTPGTIDPNAKQIVKAPQKAAKPSGDDRDRIGYVSIGDTLQSVAIEEESAGLIVLEGRKARGVKKEHPTTRESKGKNSIGRKLHHAWGDAADRQYGGEDYEARKRHWRDMKGLFWARVAKRPLSGSEVKNLDNRERDKCNCTPPVYNDKGYRMQIEEHSRDCAGIFFAAKIAAKY